MKRMFVGRIAFIPMVRGKPIYISFIRVCYLCCNMHFLCHDRIVMSNPGTMLVSLEDFWEGGHSVCRNPLLQKMFVFIGVGEKAGSGADIIGIGWRENGWRLPELIEHQKPARVETVLLLEELVKLHEGKTIEETEDYTENHTENRVRLSRIQYEILKKLKENPAYSRRELATMIENASLGGVISALSRLQELGVIRRVGPDKGGHWEIVES